MSKISKLVCAIRNIQSSVEYNIESYRKVLQKINAIKLDAVSDNRLREISAELKSRASKGASLDELLVESFSLVREVSRRVLNMYPFDTQVIASMVLHKGKIAEMQTGEGKTLAAVMSAYLNALEGKGVHVLTFNDYLARRDAQWMGPIYEFLGLTVGYVNQGMNITERQKAYSSDITYITAKEAGFDYLRDFLSMEKEQLVHRPFHYAIVDEADSILIDEARVPLVIAGAVQEDNENLMCLSGVVRTLQQNVDYETDQYGNNIYFTDTGLMRVEKIFGRGDLYSSQNLKLLARLNCALHAEFLIKRDKHYIVKDGKIEIVDEFTGRIAVNRRWPENLQAAVEAKEGLITEAKGSIMGSIALQYFLRLYPKISGMTGTAITATAEFREYYSMDVVVIPTNKQCIRKDHTDVIFTHKEAKQKAIVSEIQRVHITGQPILIGTDSVEESELIADELRKEGIKCRVLNAKNDEAEAKIIAKAGEHGAVTVSTNMAGRGIDIKLGGDNGQERDKVVAMGGLYVLGTSRYESRRIDNQLRGRAGRQGDPGETKFFISLEDDFIKQYNIVQLISKKISFQKQETPINNPAVSRAVISGQKIVEGYNSDIRRQLLKYSFIIEQQRRIIHSKRQDILLDKVSRDFLSVKSAEHYQALREQVGEDILKNVEKQITLFHINRCWADYLEYISYEREGIHLVAIGKKDPLAEFYRIAIDAFDEMMNRIDSQIIRTFNSIDAELKAINMLKDRLKGPSTTWTYLINDSPDQFSRIPNLIRAAMGKLNKSSFSAQELWKSMFGKNKN